MSCRISLFQCEEGNLLDYLNLNLSAGVYLENIDSADEIYRRLENKTGVPDILV